MRTTKRTILLSLMAFALNLLFLPVLNAQTKAKVQNVDFSVTGDRIIITYDITDSYTEESFNIWIQVKTISGKILNAKSTTGDIGKGIKGGPGKRIEWNYTLDQLNTAEEITIEVFAAVEAAVMKSEPDATTPQTKAQDVRKISVGKALVLSALLPGTGKTYIKGHGANWLMGIAGYGLITGSVLLNYAAYDNLEKYRASTDPDEMDNFYTTAQGQAIASYVCAGGALAIWVVDFITTGVKAGKAKSSAESRVDLNWKYDPYAKVPMVGLTYKF